MSYEAELEHNVFVLALDMDAMINSDEKSFADSSSPIAGSDDEWHKYLSRWQALCAEKGYVFKLAIITTGDNLASDATIYTICTFAQYLQLATTPDLSNDGDLTTVCHYISDNEDKMQQAVINFNTHSVQFFDIELAQDDSGIYYLDTTNMPDVSAKKYHGLNKLAEKYSEDDILFVSNATNANSPITTIPLDFNEITTTISNLDPGSPRVHHTLSPPPDGAPKIGIVPPNGALVSMASSEALKPTILKAINDYLAWQDKEIDFSLTHGDSGRETAENLKKEVEWKFDEKSLCQLLLKHLERKRIQLLPFSNLPALREHSLDTFILKAIFKNSKLMHKLGIECLQTTLEDSERNEFRLKVINALKQKSS